MTTWTLVLAALGLAVFLEGLPYFISPGGSRRALQTLATLNDGVLRTVGLTLMTVGLLLAYVCLH